MSPHVPSAVKKYTEMYGVLGAAAVKIGASLFLDNMGVLGPGCGDTDFAPLECAHLVGRGGAKRLEQCLKHTGTIGNDVRVTKVALEFFGEGVGLASELARLDVSYGGPGVTGHEPRFIISKFSPKELPVRLLAELYRAMQASTTIILRILAAYNSRWLYDAVGAPVLRGGKGGPGETYRDSVSHVLLQRV
jgi:hypothetical protein